MQKPTRIGSYRDLDAWQFAMGIVIDVYRVTRAFPAEEKFGLVAQPDVPQSRFHPTLPRGATGSVRPSFAALSRSREGPSPKSRHSSPSL